jgi:hypothetical protein
VWVYMDEHCGGGQESSNVAVRGHLHVTLDPEILQAARPERSAMGQSLGLVISDALRQWIGERPL